MDWWSAVFGLVGGIIGGAATIGATQLQINHQKREQQELNLKVQLDMSNLGAGKDHRYEYIIVNNSQKSTRIKEVYIELYEFNQYIERIKYVTQVDNPDREESFKKILPYSSVMDYIPEYEKFYKPNVYIRVAVVTQESLGFNSNFFDPSSNVPITERGIKKQKKLYMKK